MNIRVLDAFIAAVCYADIFDYPLTEKELAIWLPFLSVHKDVHRVFLRASHEKNVGKHIRRLDVEGDVYYGLNVDKQLVATRASRADCSIVKWNRARKVAKLLGMIPTIQLVGVTGGLTRSNAKDQDDIDFIIIAASKTLWVTRALSTILLDLFRLRRRPRDTKLRNLICLNMFMSKDGLRVPLKEQDLFTAHEVLLMTPLWERDGGYREFLQANAWVKKFLPTAWEEKCRMSNVECPMKRRKKRKNSFSIQHSAFSILEPIARFIQLRYMRKRQTSEVIRDTVIRFHPRDARVWIKQKLGERLTRFNVPLDKIFYGR